MIKNNQDPEAELIYNMVMKLGQDNYSDRTKSAIWAEATTNKELRNQALMYLCGSSERASLNLYRLHTMIVEKFFSEVA